MVCDVGEGTVHRLWEPLAAKQTPRQRLCREILARRTASPPASCAAMSGLGDFTDEAVRDPAVVALAQKVRYRIDPQNPYPRDFTGHIRATLNDGSVIEERQPHFRGGAKEPLTRADIEDKFVLNVPPRRLGRGARASGARAAAQALRRQDRSLAAAGVSARRWLDVAAQ